MMDQKTKRLFRAHIKKLEKLAIDGDQDAAKSLACMALIREAAK